MSYICNRLCHGDVSNDVKQKILTQVSDDPNKTMGLVKDLYLVLDLPAEVCLNIDVVDGLTNGSPCLVKKFDFRVTNYEMQYNMG